MGKEPLLQKVRIQEDIESDEKTRVNGGDDDSPVTFVLLLTTLTILWGSFSYGTAVSFHIFIFHAFSLMLARLKTECQICYDYFFKKLITYFVDLVMSCTVLIRRLDIHDQIIYVWKIADLQVTNVFFSVSVSFERSISRELFINSSRFFAVTR